MTREALKDIAIGIFNGSVFTSAQVPERDLELIPQIFYVLLLLDDQQRAELKSRDVGVFYERMSAASPTGINGYPMFGSVRTLTVADWEIVKEMTLRLTEAAIKL